MSWAASTSFYTEHTQVVLKALKTQMQWHYYLTTGAQDIHGATYAQLPEAMLFYTQNSSNKLHCCCITIN